MKFFVNLHLPLSYNINNEKNIFQSAVLSCLAVHYILHYNIIRSHLQSPQSSVLAGLPTLWSV